MKVASHFNLMVGVGLLKRRYLSRDENKENENAKLQRKNIPGIGKKMSSGAEVILSLVYAKKKKNTF